MSVVNKKIFAFKQYQEKWQDFNQEFFDKQKTAKTRKTKYILGMLPYPSGKLHMGHVRNYTIVDVITRLYILKDYEVFCPMGFDAFGLPAENAAREYNIHPQVWTDKNIEVMKDQLEKCCFLYNWKKTVITCKENYYKWQQLLFIEMWKKGYITKKLSYIDYDPVDGTTLAKEQIDANGKCWRSGALAEKRLLSQWFFKMSDFSERLLQDLDRLKGHWPDQIVTMQRNWIGKNQGFGITFKVTNADSSIKNNFEVFTKSPYYLPKVEFIGVAPDSEYGIHLYESLPEVKEFIQKHPRLATNVQKNDMRGFHTGLKAINPYNQEELPIYIANYVLGDYGTGIVMGVPSVCENDHQFAVVNQLSIQHPINVDKNYLENDQDNEKMQKLTMKLELQNLIYSKTVYKLKDWCISRQRYWGCPIPIIYCPKCGMLENKEIPVHLPTDMNDRNNHITCWQCGGPATKERDTMDTFVDSSWYQYRYPSATYEKGPFDPEQIKKWPQIDIYVGGPEHAVLHLLFARFFAKMLKEMNYLSEDEPFTSLYTQGMICMQTYKTAHSNMFVNPSDTYEKMGKLYYKTPSGIVEEVVIGNFEKMSKSKKNTVDPQEMLDTYGVDALRLSVISDTPANKDLQWNTDNLNGCWSFINRIWTLSHRIQDLPNNQECEFDNSAQEYAWNIFHRIIQDLDTFNFNVAISYFRILVNYIEEHFSKISKTQLSKIWIDYISLFWCLCPVVSSEILTMFGIDTQTLKLPYSRNKTESKIFQLVLQKNGKKIGIIEACEKDTEEELLKKMQNNNIPIPQYKKIILVKNKVMNFVV